MFGYISYDLRDELFKTKSKKPDIFCRNNLTFFRPRHVFLIKNKKLVIESIEDEEFVSMFLRKYLIINTVMKICLKLIF